MVFAVTALGATSGYIALYLLARRGHGSDCVDDRLIKPAPDRCRISAINNSVTPAELATCCATECGLPLPSLSDSSPRLLSDINRLNRIK